MPHRAPSSFRVVLVAASMCAAACTRGAPPSPPRQPDPSKVIAAPAPQVPVRGEASVSILSRSGAYWPGTVVPDELAVLLEPCLTGPEAVRPRVAGFVVYALALEQATPPKLVLVEKSGEISEPLAACIARALGRMQIAVPGLQVGGELLAYVSLR